MTSEGLAKILAVLESLWIATADIEADSDAEVTSGEAAVTVLEAAKESPITIDVVKDSLSARFEEEETDIGDSGKDVDSETFAMVDETAEDAVTVAESARDASRGDATRTLALGTSTVELALQ